MVTVSPRDGERYYLSLLLSHVRCPKSFVDLRTVNGRQFVTYRETTIELGLLNSDSYIEETLEEACTHQLPITLRSLFAILLVWGSPDNLRKLWEAYKDELSFDFCRKYLDTRKTTLCIEKQTLKSINSYLRQMSKRLTDFGFKASEYDVEDEPNWTREDEAERDFRVSPEETCLHERLNDDRRKAYDLIVEAIYSNNARSFFLDGPGGTGKTFLYRALLATVRSKGHIAASALPGGQTAHSRFKLPVDDKEGSTCQLSKQISVAKLIIDSKLIVWDEASMAKRALLESFDIVLKDLMSSQKSFGGKVVVFGGDFRQTLPVIPNSSRQDTVEACIINSYLWPTIPTNSQ
ncbi:OLC1v1012835C1 [Oldenlandia corymbosa var. corymbosa]|uniref:ATP-dependent DNA helicase n=1 Tax=Oldenlandia corymbosa var. corymbosa TaxID=529605 RepID=A0AAV1DWT3_OLDCO|nr:OLC1v1012835C1 [Oldenlandia corymbosa var. corymbosa]